MWESKLATLTILISMVACAPNDTNFIVSSREAPKETNGNAIKNQVIPAVPKIYQMNIHTNVSNRFAKTLVSSKVKNLDERAQEATFSVVLPDKAYISGFVMEIDGKSYEAYVKEKEEAKKIYDEAVASGIGAGHVAVSARDSNRFTVSVNVEPQSKAVFHLKYEELLQRMNEKYEIVLNIHPGQLIANLNVEVLINETRPLKFVKVPALRSGNEINKNDDDNLNPKTDLQELGSSSALVKFNPDIQQQEEYATNLGTEKENGFAGQFVVQYDVERDPNGGEVLLQDGYFVHFFAPTDLPPLPKLVVFVLDTSGSMYGIRITQLKEAMNSILPQLSEKDAFHIVEFGSNVKVWNVDKTEVQYEIGEDNYPTYLFEDSPRKNSTENQTLPSAFAANEDNKNKAKTVVDKMAAFGGTDIKSALEVGLELVAKHIDNKDNNQQPIIIFLTDGEPTVGEINTEKITSSITDLNKGNTPIFSLSFGDGADRDFLQKISLKNQGFARHIYEAADASLQLQEFYRGISSPILRDVKFQYVNNTVGKLTRTEFPILFSGAEFVVAGQAGENFEPGHVFCGTVDKNIELIPKKIETPVSGIERIWAYLTIKQILEERDVAQDKAPLTKKALDIALKYSFVTPVSSLVVVKPNETKSDVNTEDASKVDRPYYTPHLALAQGSPSGYVPLGLSYSHASPEPQSALFIGENAVAPSNEPDLVDRLFIEESELVDDIDGLEENNDLKNITNALPWLSSALSNNTTLLTLPSGKYDIGLNATVEDHPDCPESPRNGTSGQCQLLKDCPQVYSLLKDFDVFSKYFCELGEYAGICCPKDEVE